MSRLGHKHPKEVPARYRAEPVVGPVAKFMIAVCVLMACGYAVASSIPKVPFNPRWQEVDRLAQPVVDVIRKYRHGSANAVPVDLAELLRACKEAGLSGEALPADPWGRALLYEPCDSTYGSPYVRSLGADGRAGGGRENRDVSIWAGDP